MVRERQREASVKREGVRVERREAAPVGQVSVQRNKKQQRRRAEEHGWCEKKKKKTRIAPVMVLCRAAEEGQ